MLFLLQIINHMYKTLEYDFSEIEEALKTVKSLQSLMTLCDVIGVEPPKNEAFRTNVINLCQGPKLKSALVVSKMKLEAA